MKKLFIIITIGLLANVCFSQNNINGNVTYKKNIDFPKPKNRTLGYDKEIENINDGLNKLKYTLIFNENFSFFELKKSMDSDIESIHRKALTNGKGKSKFYTDLKENVTIEIKKLGGETFRVVNLKPKFKLTKETKKINGYLCYKATTSETVNFSKLNIGMKDKVNNIEAWYTPKISSQFGPLNFFGLPGLVLELKFSNVTYTAIELDIKSEEFEISKPTKGKKLSLEEFENLMIKTMKDMNVGFK